MCLDVAQNGNFSRNSLARPTSWMARPPFRNVATFLKEIFHGLSSDVQ